VKLQLAQRRLESEFCLNHAIELLRQVLPEPLVDEPTRARSVLLLQYDCK
jgi:hypothetical protein